MCSTQRCLAAIFLAVLVAGLALADSEPDPDLKVASVVLGKLIDKSNYRPPPGFLLWETTNQDLKEKAADIIRDDLPLVADQRGEKHRVLSLAVAYDNKIQTDVALLLVYDGGCTPDPRHPSSSHPITTEKGGEECVPVVQEVQTTPKDEPDPTFVETFLAILTGPARACLRRFGFYTSDEEVPEELRLQDVRGEGWIVSRMEACIPAPGDWRGPVWHVDYTRKLIKPGPWRILIVNGDRVLKQIEFTAV